MEQTTGVQKALKDICFAFLFGGFFAAIGQLLLIIWASIIGADNSLMGFAVLVSMGVIGAVLYVLGIHQKMAPIAGWGAVFPFNGFCAALAATCQQGMVEGGTAGKGISAALKLLFGVLGSGCVLVALIAVAYVLIGGMI